jgi:hypothetical protein
MPERSSRSVECTQNSQGQFPGRSSSRMEYEMCPFSAGAHVDHQGTPEPAPQEREAVCGMHRLMLPAKGLVSIR